VLLVVVMILVLLLVMELLLLLMLVVVMLLLLVLGRVMLLVLLLLVLVRHCAGRRGQRPSLVLRICLAVGIERWVEPSLDTVEGAVQVYVLMVLHAVGGDVWWSSVRVLSRSELLVSGVSAERKQTGGDERVTPG
jgi:hypothetical protein